MNKSRLILKNTSWRDCIIISPHKKIIRLDLWEEYIGTLRDVKTCEGMTFLEFDECYITFYEKLDMEKYIGKRIGILRTDLDSPYLLRVVDKKKDLNHSTKKLHSKGEIRGMDNN